MALNKNKNISISYSRFMHTLKKTITNKHIINKKKEEEKQGKYEITLYILLQEIQNMIINVSYICL